MVGFLFGGTTGLSYNDLQERRAAADALAKRIMGQQPKNVPEGIAALMQGAGAGFSKWQTNKGMKVGQEQATSGFQDYLKNKILGSDVGTAPGPNISANLPMAGAASEMASSNPAPTSFSGNQQEFISALLPAAIEEGKRTGVDPRIIVAQAAQETGWGKSAPGNNFFGIKSHGQSGGNSMMTHEYVDGKRVNVRDSFRAFESPADSVRGYGDFITQNPRYKPLREAQGLDAQLQALQASGYATDPNYSRSVGAIAKGITLPNEVASLDASAGMGPAAAIEQQAPLSRGSDYNSPMMTYDDKGARVERPYPGASQPMQQPQQPPFDPARFAGPTPEGGQPQQPMPSQQSALQPLPPPTEIAPSPQVATPPQPQQQPPQQVAQAQAQPYSGVDPKLLQLLGNPFLDENQRGVLELLVKQQMQQNDPSQKLDIQYRQAQIDALHAKSSKEDGEEWGLNPVWGKDKDGKTVLGQVSKGGKFKPLETGGFQPTPGLDRIDTGTQIITRDSRTGETLSSVPKDNRQEASEKAIGTAEGKTQAEAQAEFESITSKMPGLYGVVDRLQDLADDATYTIAGQALDFGRSQLGMPPRDAAVARAEYTATVDNQILPLLRDTFGAQFTDAEGIRLARTLGDADKTPTEKQALLRAFIQQKERDVSALRSRIGQPAAAPKGARTIGGYTIEQVD